MYINFQPHASGIVYATATVSVREGGRVKKSKEDSIYLGRVLDRERLIFKNKVDGVFQFDLNSGAKLPPPEDFVPDVRRKNARVPELYLNFGDVFFLDRFMRNARVAPLFEAIAYGNPDSLMALACFYMLSKKANRHAEKWYEGSFARILYPKADLTSQSIGEMLTRIGAEDVIQRFFKAYIPYISRVGKDWGYDVGCAALPDDPDEEVDVADGDGILIDSTGLPNSVRMPITAVSNRNGEIREEVRLIYFMQRGTGLPLYMRYVTGNIVDSTTLITTMHELKAVGVDTKFAIMDAGYVTEANLRELTASNVSVLARLPESRYVFKRLLEQHGASLMKPENLVRYRNRLIYVKRVKAQIVEGVDGYVYLCVDEGMRSLLMSKLALRAEADNMPLSELRQRTENLGAFALVSSRPIAIDKLLPLYYTRQDIEQVFDLSKSYASLLPVCVQSESAFRGHLLLTFLSTVIVRQIQQLGKQRDLDSEEIFERLGNHRCKLFDNTVLPQEVTRQQSEVYEIFKIVPPKTVTVAKMLSVA